MKAPAAPEFDDDKRDLANHLFAEATAMLEDATEIAIAGQHPQLTATSCVARAHDLQKAARAISALAEAVLVLTAPRTHLD